MMYEMKQFAIDPFDIMCGECVQHEIEYWAKVTEKELREAHEENLMIDDAVRNGFLVVDDDEWKPTPEDFNEWLEQSIAEGYVRIA